MKTKQYLLYLFILFTFSLSAQNSACLGADTLKIVVIGSSTAAGSGASPIDSAWVNRYRAYMQGLNPANTVTNLAQGGYNTWRLMPDYFTPPSSRPQPDTLRNISHVLRQNPDAIIINLPSNDAAIGTGINEQMSNFIHMDSLAKTQGVPVWVCTTQPRNFGQSQIQIQLGVRDSVKSYFGSKALDFWSVLANPQNTIDSTLDSGDGVHVNNGGHKLLCQTVIQAAVADSLVQGFSGIDLSPAQPKWLNPSPCGASQSIIEISIANLGTDSIGSAATVHLIREDLINQQTDTISQTLSSIKGCRFESVQFVLNTSAQQDWNLQAMVSHPNDSMPSNNFSTKLRLQSQALPQINSSDTLLCGVDSLYLKAQSNFELHWYSDPEASVELGQGDSLLWMGSNSDTLYLQSYRGPFYYIDQVHASNSSNINWNGCMFNLIAGADTVYLDSLDFYSANSADLQINLRTYSGSYVGHESNSAGWSSALSDSVYNAIADTYYTANFGSIKINPFDTLGCYLYLENPNHRLGYQSASTAFVFSSDGLQLEAGTGIAHTFGTSYFPRHFRGTMHYHYGFNPKGQCQSNLDTLIIQSSQAVLDLGPDQNLGHLGTAIIPVPAGFSEPFWSDSTTVDTLVVNWTSSFGGIDQWIWLEARDSLGCLHRDSLLIWHGPVSNSEYQLSSFKVYPNPNNGNFQIKALNDNLYRIQLYNLSGQLIAESSFSGKQFYWESTLQTGIYILQIRGEELIERMKIRIE